MFVSFIARGPKNPPYITSKMGNQTIYENENTTFSCTVKSDSTPTIYWVKVPTNVTLDWKNPSTFEQVHVSACYFIRKLE